MRNMESHFDDGCPFRDRTGRIFVGVSDTIRCRFEGLLRDDLR